MYIRKHYRTLHDNILNCGAKTFTAWQKGKDEYTKTFAQNDITDTSTKDTAFIERLIGLDVSAELPPSSVRPVTEQSLRNADTHMHKDN